MNGKICSLLMMALLALPLAVPARAQSSFDDLPSYDYSPTTDPSARPYKAPSGADSSTHVPMPSAMPVGTLPSFELGLQISDYRYEEFVGGSQFMRLTGPTFGIVLDVAQSLGSGWFVEGDMRGTYGDHDYNGGDIDLFTGISTPSTKSGISDWMFDARLLAGHDFLFPGAFWGATDAGLSPYLGFGFRFLYDDNTGTDSNGVAGYERFSHYLYLPIGVTPRFRLSPNSRLSVNMEYDQLLYGWQVSSLGESIAGASDLTNQQTTGYGLRGSVMYEQPHWSVGPFVEFWDIGTSNTACTGSGIGTLCGDEPHNQTTEIGLQAKYRF